MSGRGPGGHPFGAKVLGELLAAKQCLLIADDVWSLGAAQAWP